MSFLSSLSTHIVTISDYSAWFPIQIFKYFENIESFRKNEKKQFKAKKQLCVSY